MMVSPCLLMAIRTISGKLGSDVCWKESYQGKWENFPHCSHDYIRFKKKKKAAHPTKWTIDCKIKQRLWSTHCHTYLHFKERTAERRPAVNHLQKGHLSFFNSHTSLFVIRGDNNLKITNINTYIYKQQSWSVEVFAHEVNDFPMPPQAFRQVFRELR